MPRTILSLERCANGSDEHAVLNLLECCDLLALWVAANEVVAFHAPPIKSDAELDRPVKALRDAVRKVGA